MSNNVSKYNSSAQDSILKGNLEEQQLQIESNLLRVIKKLNKKYAKIDHSGAIGVIRLTSGKDSDGNEQNELVQYSYAKFKERLLQEPKLITEVYEDIRGKIKYKKERTADVFLEHPSALMYNDGLSMRPFKVGEKDTTGDSVYNMYKGLAVKRVPFDLSVIQPFLDVAELSLCGGRKVESDFLLDLIAWQFANPRRKSGVAVLFRGDGGTFKGAFMNIIRGINRHHFVKVQGETQLVGRFNAVLAYATTVFADEVDFKNQKVTDALKTLITDDCIMMEKKNVDAFQLESYINLFGATNRTGKLELESVNRRWFSLAADETYSSKFGDGSKHKELRNRLFAYEANNNKDEFLGMILDWFLCRYDDRVGSSWHPQDEMPQTDEEIDGKLSSLPPKEIWLGECLNNGEWLGWDIETHGCHPVLNANIEQGLSDSVTHMQLKVCFLNWCNLTGKNKSLASEREFERLFKGCGVRTRKKGARGFQTKYFEITSLDVMKKGYDRNIVGIRE